MKGDPEESKALILFIAMETRRNPRVSFVTKNQKARRL